MKGIAFNSCVEFLEGAAQTLPASIFQVYVEEDDMPFASIVFSLMFLLGLPRS